MGRYQDVGVGRFGRLSRRLLASAGGLEFASAGRSLLAKLAAAPLVALAWLLATRLVISTLGVEGYAVYAVVASLAVLLPFADLGTGAALVDAMASRGRGDTSADAVADVLLTSWRALLGMALVLATLAVLVTATGLGAHALSVQPTPELNWGMGAALLVFALGLPVGVAPRLLIGGGLTHVTVVFQTLAALFMLAIVVVAWLLTDKPAAFFVAPFAGMAISNALALAYVQRKFDLLLRATAKRLLKRRSRGAPVRHMAGPMFLISLLVPIAYQSDRIILSAVSSLAAVATYSVAFQVFSPLLGLVSTAGVSLWPMFAAARADTGGRADLGLLRRAMMTFAGLGLFLSLVLLLCGPTLARLAGGAEVAVGYELWLAFAVLLFLQAVSYPMAMLLTDAVGLKFQARLHLAMLALNIPLSVILAMHFDAVGPVLGSALAVACRLGPEWRRTRIQGRA